MKVIEPLTITNSILTSSNVVENDYAQWSSVTSYSIGDKVMVVGTTHKNYESKTNSNLNNDPTTDDGTNWIELGATNRWKAFDQKISDPVTNSNTVQYVLSPTSTVVNAIAFFGLEADTVRVQVVETQGSTTVYDKTYNLQDTSQVIDWYTYFFEPAEDKNKELLITDIPSYPSTEITITITDSGNTVEVGQIVLGKATNLGVTLYDTEIGIEDFSRKDTDDFGNSIIVERVFAQTADFQVRLGTLDARRVQRLLAKYRATPIVWIGDDDVRYGLLIYGFYREFSINLSTVSASYATIEVEGLT
jgi:hypothetical protein